ncbi:MAG: radical SAM protein [Magnetococcales bacterium]|nr:radical SAM protein [Magnetococcales bacterium]
MTILDRLGYFVGHARIIKPRPKLVIRILTGYARTLLLGQTVLRTMELALLTECNSKCDMCYAAKVKQPEKTYLTVAEYADLWQQARKLGTFSVLLSGGEPTLRRDILDIMAVLDPKNTIIGMTTNASRLTPDFLQALQQAGLNTLHLSLDGLDPATNDRIRGMKGHFDMVMNAIEDAQSAGLHVFLSTVVHHEGLDKMRAMVEFARKRKVGVVFSLACISGNWDQRDGVLLTGEEWQEVQAFMRANPHIRSDWTINFSLRQECPGGREKVNISPYGDVMGCGMNFISFGNIREEPLEKIWHRMQQFPYFKERSPNCLIGAHPEYIRNYIAPISGQRVPVQIDQHPSYPISLADLDSRT